MKTIFAITLSIIGYLSYQKGDSTEFTESVYWSLICIVLLATIISGIKLRQRYVNLKQKLSQKEQEIIAIKNKLHKEQETQKFILKKHAESVSSLCQKIAFLTEQKDSEAYNFLHTKILSAAEYNKFIHCFQISNPYLLNYLRTPDFKLSSYEIVLCILAYLNTPISHIGFLLDKKYDALKKAKQRIKNKMQIGRQNNIGAFLQE